jgi:hypothetical protein
MLQPRKYFQTRDVITGVIEVMPLASSLGTWLCAALSLSAVTAAQAKVVKTVAAPPFDLNGTRRELYFAWAAFCASNMIEYLQDFGHGHWPLATHCMAWHHCMHGLACPVATSARACMMCPCTGHWPLATAWHGITACMLGWSFGMH